MATVISPAPSQQPTPTHTTRQRPSPSPAPSSASYASDASDHSKSYNNNTTANGASAVSTRNSSFSAPKSNPDAPQPTQQRNDASLGANGSTSTGKVTPPEQQQQQQQQHLAANVAPAKKPGVTSRLSRMFSSKTVNNVLDTSSTTSSTPSATPRRPNHSPDGASSGSEHAPSLPSRSSSVTGSTATAGRGRTDSTNGNGAPTDKIPTVVESKEKKDVGPTGQSRRFTMLEDGTHEHLLKAERRQEKLSDLFGRMIMGRSKKEAIETAPETQLSLMSSWVDQVKSEKASDQKGGPNCADTLVEKYGKCQEVVGRGAFGIVRISHKTDSKDPRKEQLYAVKEFRRRPSESPKKYNKRLTSEFCISSALRHPNVIHTLDLMKDAKGDFCEVMEYCAGGDLYTLVLAAGKLEVVEADCYFKQMMRGVEYIHEMGVAHRDLKPENLLLTTHGALKITDFGNGECFRMAWESEPHMVGGLCGSAPYIAPEEYIDTEFDPRAVDVWACGVIYMAMRTGRHLWRVARKDEDEFYERYLEGRRDEDGYGPIETLHRARCRNVIYSILDPNPSRRITATQVLKSEWGREIKLCKSGEEGY